MTRILITGSTSGVGRATAAALLEDGHDVVVHARSQERLAAVEDLLDAGVASVVGDLADPEQMRGIAGQAQRIGPLDAVIHNAGVIDGPAPLPVNVVAPYLLTALMAAVARLRPDVHANAVDPGWVPTRMGGLDAAEDLDLAHVTQAWLATTQDPEALSSGGHWHHGRVEQTHPAVHDERFQHELITALAEHTGTHLRNS